MFFGGVIGALIGVWILYSIDKSIKQLQQALQIHAQAIVDLVGLVENLDKYTAEALRQKGIKHINDPRSYQAIRQGEQYDPFEDIEDTDD